MIRLIDDVRPSHQIWSLATVGIGLPGLGPPLPDEGARVRLAERGAELIGTACVWPGLTGGISALVRRDAMDALPVLLRWVEAEAEAAAARSLATGIPERASDCIRIALARGFAQVRSNVRMTGAATSAYSPVGSSVEVAPAFPEALATIATGRDEIQSEQKGSERTGTARAAKMLARNGDCVRVATVQGAVVGYSWARFDGSEVTLEEPSRLHPPALQHRSPVHRLSGSTPISGSR